MLPKLDIAVRIAPLVEKFVSLLFITLVDDTAHMLKDRREASLRFCFADGLLNEGDESLVLWALHEQHQILLVLAHIRKVEHDSAHG